MSFRGLRKQKSRLPFGSGSSTDFQTCGGRVVYVEGATSCGF